MSTRNLLAIDLGAESGRAVLGRFDGRRLQLEEVHRFPNGPVQVLQTLHWNVLGLWEQIKKGLARAVELAGPPDAVGIDTWGVDYGLVTPGGSLVGNPVHYRDGRTDGVMEAAFSLVPRDEIYQCTGLQFMKLNTLYQLLSEVRGRSGRAVKGDETLLFMPDLFGYFLTGRRYAEYTIASTSQMLDARTRQWGVPMLERLGIPSSILPELAPTGSRLGEILPAVVSETGATGTEVVATAGHDTASAVVAIPASGTDWCYISSGTWSLMGAEIDQPTITPQSLADNFTNEGGACGTIRFLKNIMGLWLVQECRRSFRRMRRDFDYRSLTDLAEAAPPFGSVVDPDVEAFIHPPDMPTALRQYCLQTGQPAPEDEGALVRCCLESLALRYRQVLGQLEANLGRKMGAIHIVGGGSQNALLCQMTADCCRRPVRAGPTEATAMGNLLVQAMALGELTSLAQARQVLRHSTEIRHFEPQPGSAWDSHYERFLRIVARS